MIHLSELMKCLEEAFHVPPDEMRKVAEDFRQEMIKGLAGSPSSLKMIPTYVERPTGDEKGRYIALDLGGTNFRILELELKGGGVSEVTKVSKFVLDKRYITGTAEEFFGYIADCIKAFIESGKAPSPEKHSLGFTFSFPVEQTGIASGKLLRWTKGFSVKGVLGEDIVRLLDEELVKKALSGVKVASLANDTVGTLVARSYEDKDCDIGVIIGTGTNACYSEELANIKKWLGPGTRTGQMIINIEWGNFNKLRRTPYDVELDKESDIPGQQILEKMVSGMYLGEVARLVMAELISRQALFAGRTSRTFLERYGFRAEYMSRIEGDDTPELHDLKKLLEELGIPDSTGEDRLVIKEISSFVSGRAARVSAAAMAAVITKIDPELSRGHTIAIDGSVYEKQPGFAGNIEKALKELFGAKAPMIRLALAKDGSGKGAAIIAAVASRGEHGQV